MNQLDRLYRALVDYRKQTVGDYDCDSLRKAIANANEQEDVVELERKICTVEEDWIDEIEKGLVFIEKAIREERQFIRTNGEVIPIEKVKRVDKESTTHLARHSFLLTKMPKEGEDIIPDQLYTVERLSDYAVYENRFLYMLLCYLRDFITLRYDQILELSTTYNGTLSLNKLVMHRKQRIQCEIKLVERRKNDEYLRKNNEAKDAIARIDLILKAVIHYLSTPLMEEVAKTPMLKPPITKTNVLKMNQNFKGCMALYDYISAYDKPGYTVEDLRKRLNPLSETVADEYAEATSLLSFLTYEHSMGIEDYLREEYNKEEERRKEAEKAKLAEQIKSLRKRIKEAGVSPEEYMLMLEKRNRMLESDSEQLAVAKQEIERLNGEIEVMKTTIADLEAQVQALKDEIAALIEKYENEITQLKEKHAKEIAEQKARYEAELAEQKARYEAELAEQKARYEAELAEQKARYEAELAEQKARYEAELAEQKARYEAELARNKEDHIQEIAQLKENHKNTVNELNRNYTAQIDELIKKNQEERDLFESTLKNHQEESACKEAKLSAEREMIVADSNEQIRLLKLEIADVNKQKEMAIEDSILAYGRLNALRYEYGLINDQSEFTNEAAFDELEHQFRMFKKLFRQEWSKVKKDLRQKIVWSLFKSDHKDEANNESSREESEQNTIVDDNLADTIMQDNKTLTQASDEAIQDPTGHDE